MISTSVKFVSVLAVLALNRNSVLCNPISGALDEFVSTDENHPRNISARSLIANALDTDRIVGGHYASPHEFPFMAVVHRLMGNGMVSQCGGTIISRRWVLTAGHCVQPQPRRFLLVFGINDKTGVGYDTYSGPGISMVTEEGIVHPDYRVTMNDVALLHTPHEIPFGDTIQPIQLAGKRYLDHSFANDEATVIGWGKDGAEGTGTTRLKYATLPIISNNECEEQWSVSSKHICTASGYGQDACQGDSGGPLIVRENGRPVQVGIVSYGDPYCPSNKPGVFSRVSSFIDWIERTSGAQF